jgi:hypothetical protein
MRIRVRRRQEPIKEWVEFSRALRAFGAEAMKPLIRLWDRIAHGLR